MHDTNFSCLPDLPTSDQDGMSKKSIFTKLDKLNDIKRNMIYDEKTQVQMFQYRRNMIAFQGTLSHLNKLASKDSVAKQDIYKLLLPQPPKINT